MRPLRSMRLLSRATSPSLLSVRGLACAAIASASALFAAGCHGTPPPKVNEPPPAGASSKGPPGGGLLTAQVLAALDDDAATTLFARRGDGGLVLYSSRGRWYARPVAADGKPLAATPIDAGPAPDLAPGLGSLKATADGFIAVWVELIAKNRAIKVMSFDPAGKPRGEAALVNQTGDELRWVDALPNAKGSLVVWEIPRGDRVEVDLVPIVDGKPKGATVQALKDALGWEAIATERGMAIASVVADPAAPPRAAPAPAKKDKAKSKAKAESSEGEGTGAGKTGRVVLTELDAMGQSGAPSVVSASPTAQIDVEIVSVGDRFVLAWTDERDLDASVYVASVGPGKIVAAPHRATSPLGDQALVSLVGQPYDPSYKPSGKRALLAWEDVARGQDQARLVHLASLETDGTLHVERATMLLATESGPPDLVADGDGWAGTTLAPVPEASQDGKGARDEMPIWPAYVRFGADLTVRGAEPVRAAVFAPDMVPYLTRGLSCRAGGCLTVATGGGARAPLALVDLAARKSAWKSAAWRDPDEGPPRPTFVGAIASGEHVAKVAAAELTGGAKLAAWVSFFVEGAKTKEKGGGGGDDAAAARLEVRPISAGEASLSLVQKPVLISQKAFSSGGVALAPAPAVGNKPQETVLAWVAKERGEPQVFVTKLAPDGKKLAQKGVTVIARKQRGKGGGMTDASDVAVAYDGQDGWIVAWVDTRDGDPEIYVAKVDRSMTKVIPEKRITEAVGDAADVQIFVRGKETLLAWSDARENAAARRGDIYLAHLETTSLKKLGPETRLFASKEHSRSPQFNATANGVLLSWIEEAPDSKPAAGESEAGLRLAQLDERNNVVGAPLLVRPSGGGVVISATIACASKPCRGVLSSLTGDSVQLQGFVFDPGARPSSLKVIATLNGANTEDPSPAFASGNPASLFFGDDAVGGQGRVRWMQIAW